MGLEPLSELMQRYAQGEQDVFAQLYSAIAPRLYRFCWRLSGRRSDADDVFQETFLRLHRARATYIPGANALYWAFAIARSVHFDRQRYRHRRPEGLGFADDAAGESALEAGDGYSPEADARARDILHVVTLELEKMSEKNRVAYVLLREEGLTVQEAAAVLGTTGNAVKQRAHRAYEQIQIALGAAGWSEDSHDRSWNSSPIPT